MDSAQYKREMSGFPRRAPGVIQIGLKGREDACSRLDAECRSGSVFVVHGSGVTICRSSMFVIWALFAVRVGTMARAQDQLPQPAPAAVVVDRTPATLHGIVRNAATGEPVARVLVRIEGDANAGTLTDGEGRFEISGVAVGPQLVAVHKPGFMDESNGGGDSSVGANADALHNVLVAVDMADLEFTLAPLCAIRGQIDLSTGEPAERIEVGLARRIIQDGRAVWQQSGFTKTRSDGRYRFGGLPNGEYAVYTVPTLDSEGEQVAPGRGAAAQRWGYAGVYYPDARDPSGAAKITLSNGQEAQSNMTLTREAFQTVTVTVLAPASAGAVAMYVGQVMDSAGHPLAYRTQYDQATHTMQAALPDDGYSMLVMSNQTGMINSGRSEQGGAFAGSVDFLVAGHPVTNLRVALSTPRTSPVQVSVIRSGAGTGTIGNGPISVMASSASGWIDDGMTQDYSEGTLPGPLETNFEAPGAYWLHTNIAVGGLCERSFTSGGANLGREPLTVGTSGTTAPLELALRDDCARISLSLPDSLAGMTSGVERYYTAYVVPDFDYTWDVRPLILRPSSGASVSWGDMPPGNYHVYTLQGNARLEYRNRAALAAQADGGQAVTLSPGETSNVVVEVPGP